MLVASLTDTTTKTTTRNNNKPKPTNKDNSFNHFDNHSASCSIQHIISFKTTTIWQLLSNGTGVQQQNGRRYADHY